jgi:hypothetical protein
MQEMRAGHVMPARGWYQPGDMALMASKLDFVTRQGPGNRPGRPVRLRRTPG